MVEKETTEKEDKQTLLKNSEVSLILDVYDDIFSDFDPRPFSQRAISYDLLEEAKRATRDLPSGQIQIKFLIPYKLRNLPTEAMIRRRLKEHFEKHHIEYNQMLRNVKMKGTILALAGIAMIFIATSLLSVENTNYFMRFLQVLLEPAGWFTAWTGLENTFTAIEEKGATKKFYDKMSKAEITFIGY